jgi:hypothetical protein
VDILIAFALVGLAMSVIALVALATTTDRSTR